MIYVSSCAKSFESLTGKTDNAMYISSCDICDTTWQNWLLAQLALKI